MADDTKLAAESKLCTNCKRDVSVANFVMHEIHCRRHIVLCEHCNEPVHRSEMEQHFRELHAKLPCEKCQRLVSKQDMTRHMAEECSKKLVKCEFCELSLPRDELAAHVDYCGSRTECCPLCKQYIMQKDMLRHESSRCAYPESKPQPVDPFNMGELQQFMDLADSVLGSRNPTMDNYRKNKILTNRKSELNAQRAKNNLAPEVPNDSLNSLPPDLDYDSVLALQLAHEDWLLDVGADVDDDRLNRVPQYLNGNGHRKDVFNSFLDDGGEQWYDPMPFHEPESTVVNSQVGHVDDEDMSIPCEFCEAEVPLNSYILHMDSCPLALQRRAVDLNNEHVPVQPIISRTTIPVINNLRSPPPGRYTFPGDNDDDDTEEEDVMLPCEFCQEMFPSDMIIQHQSMCQFDEVVVPRAPTPPRITTTQKPQQLTSQLSFRSSLKSPPKRQKDPAPIDFVSQDDDSALINGDIRNLPLKKVNESISNKYSPAYDRFDKAVTRPPRRTARQNSLGSVEVGEQKKESRSIQRTRASLNQLLQEDTSPEAVESSNTRKKTSTLGEPKVRRTKIVDSRTVMRHLEENRQKPPQGSSGRITSLTQSTLNPSTGDLTTVNRNRQRADHVFSPELRLKPENNPPPKKQ